MEIAKRYEQIGELDKKIGEQEKVIEEKKAKGQGTLPEENYKKYLEDEKKKLEGEIGKLQQQMAENQKTIDAANNRMEKLDSKGSGGGGGEKSQPPPPPPPQQQQEKKDDEKKDDDKQQQQPQQQPQAQATPQPSPINDKPTASPQVVVVQQEEKPEADTSTSEAQAKVEESRAMREAALEAAFPETPAATPGPELKFTETKPTTRGAGLADALTAGVSGNNSGRAMMSSLGSSSQTNSPELGRAFFQGVGKAVDGEEEEEEEVTAKGRAIAPSKKTKKASTQKSTSRKPASLLELARGTIDPTPPSAQKLPAAAVAAPTSSNPQP